MQGGDKPKNKKGMVVLEEISTLLLSQIEILTIVLIGCIGSLIGELFKEVNNNTPMIFIKFLAEFLASWFTSVIIGLILKSYFIKEEQMLVVAITGMFAFGGHQKSSSYLNKTVDKMIDKLIESKINKKE